MCADERDRVEDPRVEAAVVPAGEAVNPPVKCSSGDCGNRAERYVLLEDGEEGEHSYCAECEDVMIRTGCGTLTRAVNDPVVAERDALRGVAGELAAALETSATAFHRAAGHGGDTIAGCQRPWCEQAATALARFRAGGGEGP